MKKLVADDDKEIESVANDVSNSFTWGVNE